MKKIVVGAAACVAALIILSSCSQSAAESPPPTKDSSAETEKTGEAIFTGKLVEDGAMQDDGAIRLSLQEVQAVNDPEKMVASFESGVILNAQPEHFVKNYLAEKYTAGTTLKFSLMPTPIMTMSLPPQIPGNSLKPIEID